MIRRLVVAAVAVAGCHGLSTDFPDPQAGMRFAADEMARKSSASTQHVDIPFQLDPKGTDGTELLLGFLHAVEPRGAKYISDVSLSLQLVYKGVPIECVSKVVVEVDGADARSTAIWRADRDARWAVDRLESCRKQHAEHPAADGDTDAGSGFHAEFGDSTQGKEAISPDCKLDPRERFDKRFEHLAIAKLARPDLDRVRKQYSDFKLVEADPECHRIAHVQHQHVSANLHFMGNVDRGEPPSQPGMPANYN